MWKEARKHLLQNKATSKEMIFEFPLIAAINDGEVEIVKWLLEHDDVQINRCPFFVYRVVACTIELKEGKDFGEDRERKLS